MSWPEYGTNPFCAYSVSLGMTVTCPCLTPKELGYTVYSSSVPRKKMEQTYGEQLAVSDTYPCNGMNLRSGEAKVICSPLPIDNRSFIANTLG